MRLPVAYTLLFKLLPNEHGIFKMDNFGLFLNLQCWFGFGQCLERQRLKFMRFFWWSLEKAVIAVVDQVGPVLGSVPKSGDVIISLKVQNLHDFLWQSYRWVHWQWWIYWTWMKYLFSLPKSRETKDARFLMAFIKIQYFSKCCLFVDHTVACWKGLSWVVSGTVNTVQNVADGRGRQPWH